MAGVSRVHVNVNVSRLLVGLACAVHAMTTRVSFIAVCRYLGTFLGARLGLSYKSGSVRLFELHAVVQA
jgi:hypothetical protein